MVGKSLSPLCVAPDGSQKGSGTVSDAAQLAAANRRVAPVAYPAGSVLESR